MPRPLVEMTLEQVQHLQLQILQETRDQQMSHQLQHDLYLQHTVLQLQCQRDVGLNAAQMQCFSIQLLLTRLCGGTKCCSAF